MPHTVKMTGMTASFTRLVSAGFNPFMPRQNRYTNSTHTHTGVWVRNCINVSIVDPLYCACVVPGGYSELALRTGGGRALHVAFFIRQA